MIIRQVLLTKPSIKVYPKTQISHKIAKSNIFYFLSEHTILIGRNYSMFLETLFLVAQIYILIGLFFTFLQQALDIF